MKITVPLFLLSAIISSASAQQPPPSTYISGHPSLGTTSPKPVTSCCSCSGSDETCDGLRPFEIGTLPQMSESEVLERLDETVAAWDNGFGIW